jgi:hypothetical protein
MTKVLQAEVHSGFTGLTGTPLRTLTSILDAAGVAVPGQYPSLWKVSEAGVWSVCWQNAAASVVRADSVDNLHTLILLPGGVPLVPIFSRTGGVPVHIRDQSGGVWYVAAAFPHGSATSTTQDILVARLDSGNNLLHFADGTTEKTIVSNTTAAGRPSLTQNRYDPEQPLLLLHGDRRFFGHNQAEVWTEILT